MRLRYRKKKRESVVAVRLDLRTTGLRYRKWGALQRAKRGDWLVDNGGDVYTVDAKTFARTYRKQGRGRYVKTGVVWAEAAAAPGRIATKEGSSSYRKGDYIVSNDRAGRDRYCVGKAKFERMYRRVR
jgi:hypothetical protein